MWGSDIGCVQLHPDYFLQCSIIIWDRGEIQSIGGDIGDPAERMQQKEADKQGGSPQQVSIGVGLVHLGLLLVYGELQDLRAEALHIISSDYA